MGREVRKVKPGWNHPLKDDARPKMGYQPMFNESYQDACKQWKEGLGQWEQGRYEGRPRPQDCEFWEWYGGPPDPQYYRPHWRPEEMTSYAVYETVSEGTPTTPAFQTKEELVDYLVANGDYWDQERGDGGWDREAAEKFVGCGFAPSMMVSSSGIHSPRDKEMYAKEDD